MKNLIIGILMSLSIIGCSEKKVLLSPAEMKEDIQFYFHLIRDIHPDPYQRYDSMTFVTLEAKMIESCSRPMTARDFGFRLMKTKKFLDGHAGISNFFSTPGRYHFPIVEFKDSFMLLDNDTLLAVKDNLATYTASDIDSMISWEQPPRIRNENMNVLLNLLLTPANKSTATYTGVLKTANGVRDTVIGVDIRRKSENPIYSEPYASTFFPEDSMAVLYYNTCMIYGGNDVKRYIEFVDTFFYKLKNKGIKTLFIDVTHNGGGSDGNNSAIINHLRADEFTSKIRMTGKKAGIEEYLASDLIKKYLDLNKDAMNRWMETFGNPIMEKGVAFLEGSSPARDSGYEGKVFVIMGNNTYSAGADFCLAIKISNAAILVGEETGQYYPICGNVIIGTLPNSKIQYQMPSTETFYGIPNGHIYPDIPYPLKEDMGLDDYKKILTLFSSSYTP